MNFIEAVKSGKRFKPLTMNNNHDYDWIECKPKELRCNWGSTNFSMTDYDFYTSEFVLEDKEITITESKFDDAFNEAFDKCVLNHKEFRYVKPETQLRYAKEILGF